MKQLSVAAVALFLVACSSKYQAPDANAGGRYKLAQDTGPTDVIRPEDIVEVQPRWEPKSSGGNKSPYTVRGVTYHIMDSEIGYVEEGNASWYGAKFHGYKTSNGEIFDMYQVSAAHKTLPLPTWVRVTNLANNKSLIVRVNDRGPFHPDRIIDLSYAAAVKLDIASAGVGRVRVEALDLRDQEQASFILQLAALGDRDRARELAREAADKTNQRVEVVRAGNVYRVQLGPVKQAEANTLSQQVSEITGEPPLIRRQ
ncbi:septal ring lytic transglycosylase RlpA family protein [Salinibius halmophilus]|uniref:septal ring lytic transglycosylase RlpA family protein n=1 Tax=Salinibius halmophilus TaxID=1853216 RepID=UPI000E667BD8|nr:septal ring lytic transglycosylase RlpA family protein [Salinibius halmophilus]